MIRATAGTCDFFLPSFDDIRVLSGATEPQAALAWCRGLGAPVVVLKCGREGVYVADDRTVERIAGHAVATVDATGAGDCFDGAFAARIVAGDDPVDAARYANAAAALATTGYGAVAPLPRDADGARAARGRRMIGATFRDDLFAGRVALVSGGTSGIGAGIADALAALRRRRDGDGRDARPKRKRRARSRRFAAAMRASSTCATPPRSPR